MAPATTSGASNPRNSRTARYNPLARRPLTRSSAKKGDHRYYRSIEQFPRFVDLPVELRLQIWKAALPKPRVVSRSLYGWGDKDKASGGGKSPEAEWQRNSFFTPAVAHACRESRGVFLGHYENFTQNWDYLEGVLVEMVYMNFKRDVLNLGWHGFEITMMELWNNAQEGYVRNKMGEVEVLLVDLTLITSLVEISSLVRTVAAHFQNLKKLVFYRDSVDPELDPSVARKVEKTIEALLRNSKGGIEQTNDPSWSSFSGWESLLEELGDVGDLNAARGNSPEVRIMAQADFLGEMNVPAVLD
jgi:hypothetical protein